MRYLLNRITLLHVPLILLLHLHYQFQKTVVAGNDVSKPNNIVCENKKGKTVTEELTASFNGNSGDEEYVNEVESSNCECIFHNDDNVFKSNKDNGGYDGARIAYLITLHNQRTLEACISLIKAIASQQHIILIHIDTKFPKEDYENSSFMKYIHDCSFCGASFMIESIYDLEWGQWSMMEPTLWAMRVLTSNPKFNNQWDVFINLSSDSMPVYTPQTLSRLFDVEDGPLKDINFVTSHSCITGLRPTNINIFPSTWHKRKHYEQGGAFEIIHSENDYYDNHHTENNNKNVIHRNGNHLHEMKTTLQIHFGSQWMILTPSFVRYITESMARPDSLPYQFKEELIRKKVLMADEIFIPTLISHHSIFNQTLPRVLEDGNLESMEEIYSIRYERMDENLPDAFGNVIENQKYEVPESYDNIDIPKAWGPYYLGVYDLANIKDTGALFIRKVNKMIDSNIFHILPVNSRDEIPYIQWPNEVRISKKMDWERLFAYMKYKEQNDL